jgi:phosphate transport system substrate-binding protein
MTSMNRVLTALAFLAAVAAAPAGAQAAGKIKGEVRIDGSSTVYPITEAVAEEFRAVQPKIRVSVGFSGTGGGFKKFNIGETDINDASRPIKDKEAALAEEHGISFIELPVAYDGLSVVVNPKNDFVDHLTVEELHRIWMPESKVTTWKDVRPEWPDENIDLYGPGVDSGTFDYFTEAINGKSQVCRSDFTASEDDNVLVQGVAGDQNSLGFFGYAYYVENREKLKVVPIDGGNGPVAPSEETINNGTYAPLSRPIFIYVSKAAAERSDVEAFVSFYLESASALAGEVGYVPLPEKIYALGRERFAKRVTGSVFQAGSQGVSLEKLMALESAGT